MTDASQNVESLVLVIRDVTSWHSLEERIERIFACNPAPRADLPVVRHAPYQGGRGIPDMTGYSREAVIDLLFHEPDMLV